MKKSLKTYSIKEEYNGHTILIYGERWEEGYIDGIVIKRARFSKDGGRLMDKGISSENILLKRPYTRTRYFNMGWAICNPNDKFDFQTGVDICKKRFRKSPMETETGLFLTNDMIHAILKNEVDFIKKNWDKFCPEKKEAEKPTEVKEAVKENTSESNFDIKPGDYVKILDPDNPYWPETVGFVSGVDDEFVYYKWKIQYGKNHCAFETSTSPKDIWSTRKELAKATPAEISAAINAIAIHTSFNWDSEKNKLRLK